MNEWLERAASRLAGSIGAERGEYALSEGEIATLLEAARIAAHESGERTSAPLLCYLLGLARGGNRERSLSELAKAASGGEL